MKTGVQNHHGGCHCGRVRFRVAADLGTVTACNCSFCTKKGGLSVRVEADAFEVIQGQEGLDRYGFGTGRASHWFCRHCGIQVFTNPRIAPEKIAVNVRCIDDIDVEALTVVPFDGRNWEAAVAAHQKKEQP